MVQTPKGVLTMECQVYLLEPRDSEQELINEESPDYLEAQTRIAYFEECARVAEESGFNIQARLHRQRAEKMRRDLLVPPFPEVTDGEWEVYRRYLPTAYRKKEVYAYDIIPLDAMKAICGNEHYFDSIEIRTPEGLNSDPVAFGIREKEGKITRYRIASWAESRVLEAKDMLKELIQKVDDNFSFWNKCFYPLGGICLGMLLSGIVSFLFSFKAGAVFIFSGGVSSLLVSFLFFQIRHTLRKSKEGLTAIQL